MNEPERSVSERELHAYVDNQLDAARRPFVDLYLAEHPDEAKRVAFYQRQRAILRSLVASPDARPIPPYLHVDRIVERLGIQRMHWRLAAAIVLGIGLGGIGGWYVHSSVGSDPTGQAIALLEQEALATHAVYFNDRRQPLGASVPEREHLKQWLSDGSHPAIAPPDLAAIGYQLLGARLLATERGSPAALFVYEDAGRHRLLVVIHPMPPELRAPRFEMAQGKTNGCGWIENGMGYAVVAALPDEDLDRVADRIRAEAVKPTG